MLQRGTPVNQWTILARHRTYLVTETGGKTEPGRSTLRPYIQCYANGSRRYQYLEIKERVLP